MDHISAKWIDEGTTVGINIETALEQYYELGYMHRIIQKLRCPICNMHTYVDGSIEYKFCPHCGAKLDFGVIK